MSQENAWAIVQEYHKAWTTGNIDRAMALVSDDIRCQAPGMEITGKAMYRQFIAGFAPALTGIGDIAEFVDREQVALFYYPQTAQTSDTSAAECFTVRDGQIVHSILIFDRLSYAPPPQAEA